MIERLGFGLGLGCRQFQISFPAWGRVGDAELTWPLLLAYMHPAEATARWERINAGGSRVVIVLRPVSVTGRRQVK